VPSITCGCGTASKRFKTAILFPLSRKRERAHWRFPSPLLAEPTTTNHFHREHAALLIASYRHFTGHDLLPSAADFAQQLYRAPFVVLSHDTAPDPRFTYANLAAQRLFEMPWEKIVGLPSRYSAEAPAREERERLLARVAAHGYIDDYCGVRVAASGKRFAVKNATVWNVVDAAGRVLGQAACFGEWTYLGGD
jgi:hypothetical protein